MNGKSSLLAFGAGKGEGTARFKRTTIDHSVTHTAFPLSFSSAFSMLELDSTRDFRHSWPRLPLERFEGFFLLVYPECVFLFFRPFQGCS